MTPGDILPDDLLDRIRGRAAGYDRDNAFCQEDLDELAAAGYLKLFVPTHDGGLGLGLAAAVQCQRRLAKAGPATALAVNMHLVWTGVAHVLAARGDTSLDFVLAEAAQGEIFAFGLSEAGNDSVLFDSTTTAVADSAGGYTFTGTKIFTSLAPAWTRLGIFGKDPMGRDDEGELVHGFLHRDSPNFRILDDWDTLGMRASQSRSTVLEGAYVPADRIFRKLPTGPNPDPLVFAIFACFETLISAVYTGMGERALQLGVEAVQRRTSARNGGRSLAQDPDVRRKVAQAAMAMDALYPQLQTVAADVDTLADHGAQWFPRLVGLKVNATETARRVVDCAIRVSGGASYSTGAELERLYRDVLAGMFHPSSDDSAHNTVANAWLGPLAEG